MRVKAGTWEFDDRTRRAVAHRVGAGPTSKARPATRQEIIAFLDSAIEAAIEDASWEYGEAVLRGQAAS